MGLAPVPRDQRMPLMAVRREAVSIKTAAQLLDVHEMTVRRLVWAGKLRAFRVGTAIRIRRDVLRQYTERLLYNEDQPRDYHGRWADGDQLNIPQDLTDTIADARATGRALGKTEVLDALPPAEVAKVKAALAKGGAVTQEFHDALNTVAQKHGLPEAHGDPEKFNKETGFIVAPIKSLARSAEKVVVEKAGNVRELKDVVRGTLVVKNVADARAVLATFQAQYEVLDVKDRFANPLKTGYRDLFFRVKLSNGVQAEVQVHTRAMLTAKNGTGHKIYEELRTLSETTPRYKSLQRRARVVYDRAWASSRGLQ